MRTAAGKQQREQYERSYLERFSSMYWASFCNCSAATRSALLDFVRIDGTTSSFRYLITRSLSCSSLRAASPNSWSSLRPNCSKRGFRFGSCEFILFLSHHLSVKGSVACIMKLHCRTGQTLEP